MFQADEKKITSGRWILDYVEDVESMMAFGNGGNSSQTLDYFVFGTAGALTNTQPGYSKTVGITTVIGTTTLINTTTNDSNINETTVTGRQKLVLYLKLFHLKWNLIFTILDFETVLFYISSCLCLQRQ